ncbi:MAG: DNA mismatch endonuclease Vsr [Rhodobacterales bacterium]|nr:DNA mismatch endonuclease Vsr [Rhodobacterales bacterium]
MVDVVSSKVRSRMMAGIGGKDTKPELVLRKGLFALGLRYRLHDRKLPGRPDIVLPKWNAVVFVNGCFWHRHPGCRFATTPSTRTEFWLDKFEKNVARDRRNVAALRTLGWRILVVWECDIKADPGGTVALVDQWIRDGDPRNE